jgi:hypothetical protein
MRDFRPNTAIFVIDEKKEEKTDAREGNFVVSYFGENRKG